MKQRAAVVGLSACLAMAAFVARPTAAQACGGCFAPPESNQVVTDHRMVMAVHPTYSVLWDQIRYTGRPEDFAWVLPVSGDVTIEVASEQFFAQLDGATAVQVQRPFVNLSCPSSGRFLNAAAGSPSAGADAGSGVQVINEAVVGPYQTVTLRATDTDALTTWLRSNQYTIPPSIEPTIRWYTERHMDFVALRLRPGEGVSAMQPVRIRFNTPNMVLPLRMVAAGVADKVGITLWVFGSGRYEAANFANGTVDPNAVVWDWTTNSSNYRDLFNTTLRSLGGGRAWLTEYAQDANALASLRYQTSRPSGETGPTVADEWNLATNNDATGMWVTRLRTDLLPQFLDADLQLQPSASSVAVSNRIQVRDGNERGERPRPNCPAGGGLFAGFPTGGTGGSGSTGGGMSCAAAPGTWGGTSAPTRGLLALGAGALGLAIVRRRSRRQK